MLEKFLIIFFIGIFGIIVFSLLFYLLLAAVDEIVELIEYIKKKHIKKKLNRYK